MKIIRAGFELMFDESGDSILKKIEQVARTCYKSEDLITDESADKMVRALIKRGHVAMLEHFSCTVKLYCDRGVSHEVVRHRVASYAQESTRYCNYGKDKFGKEITYIDLRNSAMADPRMQKLPARTFECIMNEWLYACEDAERHYLTMLDLGCPAEFARSVLNNSTKTEICITMNLREWRHFFALRACRATGPAHPQMEEIARPLLAEFKKRIPVVFADLEV